MYIETDDWIHFEETDMPFLAALGWEQAVQTVLAHQAAHGDFPFLYDPLQLAAFLCTNRKTLFDLVNYADDHYRRLELRKKSGGVRALDVPDDELKVIQRRIQRQILMKFSPSEYASAYVRRRTLPHHAAPHVGKRYLLKLDIADFFGSIRFEQIHRSVFHSGYFPKQIGVMLTKLCCFRGALPQGAPTSPAISNLVMRQFDRNMGRWCASRGIAYTRYSDDMAFSGERPLYPVYEKAKAMLEEMGFTLNEQKTRFVSNAGRQSVTGLTVNEKISVSREYKRRLRQEIYYTLKFGAVDSILKAGRRDFIREGKPDAERYLQHLIGKAQFMLQIEPGNVWFADIKMALQKEIERSKYNDRDGKIAKFD